MAVHVIFLAPGTVLGTEISIPSSTTIRQNFDTIGSSGTATLPDGWVMTGAGVMSPSYTDASNFTTTTQAASSGAPTTGGRYNWGSSNSERAIGFMTSGSYASPNSIMAGFQNEGSTAITSLSLGFDYERYRTNTAAANITFFVSTDGTNWTSVTGGDQSYTTGSSSYSFPPTSSSKSFTLSGLNIAVGAKYYLRWNFNTTGSNSQGLGLDNVALTATFNPLGGVRTWSGGGANSDFESPGNWDDVNVPASAGDSLVFTGGNAASATAANMQNDYAVTALTFQAGANAFVINGAAGKVLRITTASGISDTSGQDQTINVPIVVHASQTWSTSGGGNLTISGPVSAANKTITINAANASNIITLSGGISGAGVGVVKTGLGQLALSGSSNYSGTTTISGGYVIVSGGSAIGDASAVVLGDVGGAGLDLRSDEVVGSIAGGGASGGSILLGTHSLTVGGDNTSTSFAGVISGQGSLVKNGTGRLTLAGANSYTGQTVVSAGTLALTPSGALDPASGVNLNGALDMSGGAASATIGSLKGSGTVLLGTKELRVGSDNSATQFDGVISGSGGSLTKVGTGKLTITNTLSSYSGATTINDGVLSTPELYALGGTATSINLNGGTLQITSGSGTGASTHTLIVGTGGGFVEVTGTNTESNGGGSLQLRLSNNTLSKAGSGTLALTLGNDNAGGVEGTVNVLNGTLNGSSSVVNALPPLVSLRLGDATSNTFGQFNLNGRDQQVASVASLVADSRNQIFNSSGTSATLTITALSAASSFSGRIGGGANGNSLGVTKNGPFEVAFAGANTYSGTTNVAEGTLRLDGTHTGGGSYFIGATTPTPAAALTGTGSTDSAVTVRNGSKLAPGTVGTAGRFSVRGLTLNSGSTLAIELGGLSAGAEYDQLVLKTGSTVASISGSLSLSLINGFSTATPPPTRYFTILRNDTPASGAGALTISGTFAGLAENATIVAGLSHYVIHYNSSLDGNDGNDIVLESTPEPGSVCAAGFLGWIAMNARRRRRHGR